MKFEIYFSYGKYRWRLKAANGEKIASGQGYKRLEDCRHCISLLKNCKAPIYYIGMARYGTEKVREADGTN